MSATGRGAERREDDWYSTPPAVTRLILPHLRGGKFVLDPVAGKGAILDVARESGKWDSTYGIELDPVRAAVCGANHSIWRGSAFERADWNIRGETVLTNPPFSSALPAVERAIYEIGTSGEAAFLLRLAFLESAERAKFHRENPSDVYVLARRPSFCVSVRCKKSDERPGCGWNDKIEVDAPRPKQCPACDLVGLSFTSSDSAAYAWFLFGDGHGGHIEVLDTGDDT